MRFRSRFIVCTLVLALPSQIIAGEPAPPAASEAGTAYPSPVPIVSGSSTGSTYPSASPYSTTYPSTTYSWGTKTPESHVQQALEHLKAAGLQELADEMANRADKALLPRMLARKRAELEALQGKVSKLEEEIQELHQALSGAKQVMVELKLLGVSRRELRKLGLDVNESSLGRFLLNASGDTKTTGQQKLAIGLVDQNLTFTSLLKALQQKGVVKVLAEPTLVTLSGCPASFQSGGEVPVLEPPGDGATSLAIKFRQVGLRIDMLAIVLGDGRISLELRPTISQLDPYTSKTVVGQTSPAINKQTIDFGVKLKPGQTVAVGGIVNKGNLFAGDSDEEAEPTELILLATPTLVEREPGPIPPKVAKPPVAVPASRYRG